MKTIGNIIWLIINGFTMGLGYLVLGVLWCLSIIGIPFGKQCFKLAALSFWPFGKTVRTNFDRHPIANLIWLILGGLTVPVGFLIEGLLWCITIVGIPFGKQCFKLAKLSLIPFGADIY